MKGEGVVERGGSSGGESVDRGEEGGGSGWERVV